MNAHWISGIYRAAPPELCEVHEAVLKHSFYSCPLKLSTFYLSFILNAHQVEAFGYTCFSN